MYTMFSQQQHHVITSIMRIISTRNIRSSFSTNAIIIQKNNMSTKRTNIRHTIIRIRDNNSIIINQGRTLRTSSRPSLIRKTTAKIDTNKSDDIEEKDNTTTPTTNNNDYITDNSNNDNSSNNNEHEQRYIRIPNKELQEVIREGIGFLNHIAINIQNDSQTHKSIFLPKYNNSNSNNNNNNDDGNNTIDVDDDDNDDDDIYDENQIPPTSRQLSEQHRLYHVAQECLDEICSTHLNYYDQQQDNTNSSNSNSSISSSLIIRGEPIVLIALYVNVNLRYADLYYTIPSHLLFHDSYTIQQKLHLQDVLDKNIQYELYENKKPSSLSTRHNKKHNLIQLWMKHIYTKLSSYYPPKIRLKPATPLMLQQVIGDYNTTV